MNKLGYLLRKLNIGLVLMAMMMFAMIWSTQDIKVSAEGSYQVESMTGTGSVTADTLKVRSGPGKDYDTAGLVSKGEKVSITGEADGWYRIDYEGVQGFVSAEYVEVIGELTAEEVGADSSDDKDSSTDTKEDKKEKAEQVGEPEEGYSISHPNPKWFILFGVVIVILVMVISIIYTLRKMGDEEDDDEYEDEGYDEEYEDEYEDEGYDEEYEDEYQDEAYDEEYDEYDDRGKKSGFVESREYRGPERRKSNQEPSRKEVVIREEDYRVDIDPSFFETTTIIVQPDAVTGYVPGKLDKEEKLNEAMDRLNRLQEEIEKLKNED